MNPAQMPRSRHEPIRTLTAMFTPVLMRLTPPGDPKAPADGENGRSGFGAGAELILTGSEWVQGAVGVQGSWDTADTAD